MGKEFFKAVVVRFFKKYHWYFLRSQKESHFGFLVRGIAWGEKNFDGKGLGDTADTERSSPPHIQKLENPISTTPTTSTIILVSGVIPTTISIFSLKTKI